MLSWAMQTAGGALCSTVLSTGPAGSALLQHVMQCCLLSAVGCLGVLQPSQHQELLAAIAEAGDTFLLLFWFAFYLQTRCR